ncbi:peptidoglycan DD-metalloendopeptidase family protein [Dyella flagellata]|uniref:Lipoprotein n=2 Tax=Dyella flagellata TaxID=1867833 RepID=A0ABQ5XDA0_9GAMM|nr:lipoprotein [Dyella flagellata]
MLARMNGLTRCSALAVIALALAGCSTVVVQPPPGAPSSARPAPSAAPAGTYTVVKGDTLYSIAFRNGTDFRDVAKLNGIAPPYTIWPGQSLKLPGHGAEPAAVHVSPPVAVKGPEPATTAPVFQTVETKPAAATSPAHASSAAAPVAAAHPLPPPTAVPVPAPSNPSPAVATAATPVVAASSGSTRTAGGVKWRWPASGQVVGRFQSGAAIPGIDIAGKQGDSVVAAADGTVVYSGNGLVGYGELIIIKHNDSFLSAYGHNRKRLVTEGQQVKAGQQIAEMGSSGSTRDELQFQIRKDGNPVDPLEYLPSR